MFLVQVTFRAHSSGSVSNSMNLFQTLEEAVSYITNDWYPAICEDYDWPDTWDMVDCKFSTKEEFSESVKEKVKNMRSYIDLFSPYSEFCAHVPVELTLQKIEFTINKVK